ncbi:efflux RND transporter permease subunit [Curvivirga sp.]|uniref:efflux RND transporter permease subunit n=1 Tax=Curvivirga sp. TaxID=2856848 RepID=UPI003B58EB97
MNISYKNYDRGPIAWMAKNPVAANLLMVILLIGGIVTALQIQKEVHPQFQLDIVTVDVGYPGAAPSEVETGVLQPVEEAIRGLEGIRDITSEAKEGSGSIQIELVSTIDHMQAFQNIDQAIARIQTFPNDAEEPEVKLQAKRTEAMQVGLFGPVDEWTLRNIAEGLRDRFLSDPNITQVELQRVPEYITHVEISNDTLRQYGLTLQDVSQVISQSSQDIPAGAVRTYDGEILLRMNERKIWAQELRNIYIIADQDGGIIQLGDLATIKDGFIEGNFHSRFNGMPSVELSIFRTGSESPLDIEQAVMDIMTEFETTSPPGVEWRIDSNNAQDFRERLNLILENGTSSIVIVLLILSLFLAAKLGFWVMMGMTISYVGSVLFLPPVGVTINMVSLFGFLVALGLVVDDAIVIGENVFEERKKHNDPMKAAIIGTKQVAMPVIFSILTTLIAFVPLLFIPGETGLFWWPLPVVVITVLTLSLFEALFILPAHLGHVKKGENKNLLLRSIKQIQMNFSNRFDRFVYGPYKKFLEIFLRNRYITITAALAFLIVIGNYATSAHMGIINMPEVSADEIEAGISMPVGTTPAQAGRMALKLTEATKRMYDEHNLHEVAEGIKTNVRGQDSIDVEIVMRPPNERDMSAKDVIELWRDEIGDIHGVDQINFEAERGPGGWRADISVDLSHSDINVLEKASQRLVEELKKFSNTSDIGDNFDKGKKRIDFRLLPEGSALGLTPEYVGQQLRGAFFGLLAIRQLRSNSETEIRVKLPESERNDLSYLENFIIQTPLGSEVPLFEVTELTYTEAFSSITRRNGKRIVNVSTDVEPKREITQIVNSLNNDILPQLRADYPGLSWSFEGSNAEMQKSMNALWKYFGLAMIVIYALLAVAFRNYSQPFIVLSAIPFGAIGAVIGHIIMGYDISIISMMGVVALSGVVLNASLIMTDYANRLRAEMGDEITAYEAISQSGLRRFRPIVLTTLTTFGGLTPILLETSLQAQYLIPMAISLGFGVLFSTAIILILVPCLYMVFDDLKSIKRFYFIKKFR